MYKSGVVPSCYVTFKEKKNGIKRCILQRFDNKTTIVKKMKLLVEGNDLLVTVRHLSQADHEKKENLEEQKMLDKYTTEHIIPYGQTKIGDNDFSHCKDLAHLYIPYYVKEIPDSNFFDRSEVFKSSLQASGFTIHGEKGTAAETYANKTGILFEESTMWVRGNHLMAYFGKVGEVFIPSEIEKIQYRAFQYAPHVFFVNISNNVTAIESEAFANCAIKEIAIPKNVTSIGSRVFMNCKELVSATFENANTVLDNECFKGCHNDLIIKASSGGTVEEYARKYNIKFEAI